MKKVEMSCKPNNNLIIKEVTNFILFYLSNHKETTLMTTVVR